MKNIKYLSILLSLSLLIGCNEPEDVLEDFNALPEETVDLPALTAGSADFSTYVSLGNSLTAGFSDGTVFRAAQENSYPSIMAQQFALVGGGTFTQPLVNDNFGGLAAGGNRIAGPRLITTGGAPQPLESVIGPVTVTTDIVLNKPTGPFNNMGVSGANSFHLLDLGIPGSGYGDINGLGVYANPYFIRMASAPDATIIGDAMAQNPTFFSLWIGANDVLGYATSGGDGSITITDQTTFDLAYGALISSLTSGGAKGVIANVPNVESAPFFNTVPNNALVIDAATAGQLTGFFQAVAGIFTQVLIAQMVPPANAQQLASQYAITFEEGANRFLIDVPVTATNPLGFRQMTEEEKLLLPIDQGALAQGYGSVALTPEVLQVLGILQAGGTPTPEQGALVIGAVNGIDDGDALDSDELQAIRTATNGYNATISAAATANGLAFVDSFSITTQIATSGYSSNGFTITGGLVTGGGFGLDGIHGTSRGYALFANEFLKAIDVAYGSNFEASGNLVNLGDYPTNYSPLLQ
ncbi:G-D-S-L family lipolytic protein [Algibacter aquimarinus]|uniref:SGNH/GDSL hydrolase family protein n=1 Tax=Algibacter aquimarinus TaxID=1136748 RepID=A0ABP9HB74_9FLAO